MIIMLILIRETKSKAKRSQARRDFSTPSTFRTSTFPSMPAGSFCFFHVNILFLHLYIVHDHRPGKIAMAMTAKERSQTKKRRRAEEVKSRQAGRREGGLLWRQNGRRAGEREAREGGKGAAERNLRWQGEPEGKIQAGGTPKHHLPIFKMFSP